MLVDTVLAAVGAGTTTDSEVSREELEARVGAGRRRQARALEGEL